VPLLPVFSAAGEDAVLVATLWSCCSAIDDKDFLEQVQNYSCCAAHSFVECVKIGWFEVISHGFF
jgi:hypothetical protein